MKNERHSAASVAVSALGRTAARALARSRQWQVLSRYDRCFYCGDGSGAIICVAAAELGRGPFVLSCETGARGVFPLERVCDRFEVAGPALVAIGGELRFDLQAATVWEGGLKRFCPPSAGLEDDLSWLAGCAAASPSVRGLGLLIPQLVGRGCGKAGRSGPVERLLATAVLAAAAEVSDDFRRRPQGHLGPRSVALLEGLIGLGFGLTPSGDDFLAGLVLGLFRAGLVAEAERLAGHFYRTAGGAAAARTTAVSLAFYGALAEGSVSEAQHDFIAAFGLADRQGRAARLRRLESFGASSGWDMLAGFALILELWRRTAAAKRERLEEAC